MGMMWQHKTAEQGGIASVADLHAMGLTDVDIRMFAGYGSLVRVRRGWYATPDTHPDVVEACRLGGRLACRSALELNGEAHDDDSDDDRLHIEGPANSVSRLAPDERDRVRVHWARRPSSGSRGVVSAEAARRQAVACQPWSQH